MKTKLIILSLAFIALGTNIFFTLKADKQAERRMFLLKNLEASASDNEFSTGPTGSNWKEYTTDCTYTETVNGSITVGVPGIIGGSVGGSSSKTWTEYNKSVCGYGMETCLSFAGC